MLKLTNWIKRIIFNSFLKYRKNKEKGKMQYTWHNFPSNGIKCFIKCKRMKICPKTMTNCIKCKRELFKFIQVIKTSLEYKKS